LRARRTSSAAVTCGTTHAAPLAGGAEGIFVATRFGEHSEVQPGGRVRGCASSAGAQARFDRQPVVGGKPSEARRARSDPRAGILRRVPGPFAKAPPGVRRLALAFEERAARVASSSAASSASASP
jgi:hypothetical protein